MSSRGEEGGESGPGRCFYSLPTSVICSLFLFSFFFFFVFSNLLLPFQVETARAKSWKSRGEEGKGEEERNRARYVCSNLLFLLQCSLVFSWELFSLTTMWYQNVFCGFCWIMSLDVDLFFILVFDVSMI